MSQIGFLKKEIKKLSKTQKKELQDFLLLEQATISEAMYDRNAMLFYNALEQELKFRIRSPMTPFGVFRTSTMFSRFKKAQTEVDKFLQSAEKIQLKTEERVKFYRIAVGLFADRAEELDAPLSLSVILNQASHIAGLFDNEFPGYAKSGLLRKVLQKR